MPVARPVENFSFDRDSGEWDYVLPAGDAEFSRADRQHLRAVHDRWSWWADRCDFDVIFGQLRPRVLSILALPRAREIRGARVVIRHWRAGWVQQRPEQAPLRLDYRGDSEPWINAMRRSLEKNRHLSMAEAYRFAVHQLGEPRGAGRPESKQARMVRLYRIRYGSHKRP